MEASYYTELVKWAHGETEYKYGSACLTETATIFADNIDRIRCQALSLAVVTAHALRIDKDARGIPAETEDLFVGARAVEEYIASVPAVSKGYKSLLASLVIGAWTAFEALATDLWVMSVNLRPKSLGQQALKSKRRGQDGSGDVPDEKARQKPNAVDVDILAKYDFDLKDRLGYFLWREGYFDFNSLLGMSRAYKTVFKTDKWFNEDVFLDLRTLEALRHVLVHRGGRADKAFADRVEKHPVLSQYKAGDMIELNGVLAGRSVELALVCGFKLLDRVGGWLEANPK